MIDMLRVGPNPRRFILMLISTIVADRNSLYLLKIIQVSKRGVETVGTSSCLDRVPPRFPHSSLHIV